MDDKNHANYVGMKVIDLNRGGVLKQLIKTYRLIQIDEKMRWVAPIHVGSLKYLNSPIFQESLASAEFSIADGMAVVLLAKIEGAKNLERCSTTDFALPLVKSIAEAENGKCKVALIGGPEGLASAASTKWVQENNFIESVYTSSGYKTVEEWNIVYSELRQHAPDLIFLGLGQPFEFEHIHQYHKLFPAALVVPCGGLFGFIANSESRAPKWMQKIGTEWVYRLMHSPRRLAKRYMRGSFDFVVLSFAALRKRIRS